jgi:hypothetical protein
MRYLALAMIAALGACATTVASGGGAGNAIATAAQPQITRASPSPFPLAPRGSALPPPALASAQAAPPEGTSAAGIDFGAWRHADAGVYATSFQAQMRARYHGRDAAGIRADLQANGFACEDVQRLDCRIEINEQHCAYDWYVVVESGRSDPVAGFEKVCSRQDS